MRKNSLLMLVFVQLMLFANSLSATNTPLFTISTEKSSSAIPVEGTYLTIDKKELKSLYKNGGDQITITIPQFAKASIEVTLSKVQLLGDNFYVSTQSDKGRQKSEYTAGNYYQNTTAGNLAAISVFENEISGVFSIDGSQYTLGAIISEKKSDETSYIFYNESATPQPSFNCGTEDTPIANFPQTNSLITNSLVNDRLVYSYFEIDYELYELRGGVAETVNFITGMFNAVQAIYNLEEVNLQISEISVWTQADSYDDSSTANLIQDFQFSVECVNGDLAHYIDLGYIGGRAYINGLCQSYNFGVSSISNSYLDFPAYNYNIYIVAHETGHLLGSPHTHSCSWPGGPIDNCAPTDGICDPGPPNPPNGGTIMSYCTGFGNMDFNLGLGPLPGQLVRDVIDSKTCLEQVEYVSIFGEDFYGCSNGLIDLDATYNGCQNCTYLWNDGVQGAFRQVEIFEPTDYCVSVTDEDGNVFADHIAVNVYSLNADLNINSPTECSVGSVVITPSGGTGNYTYAWSDGSTESSNNNLEPGTYSVTIEDGVCELVKLIELEPGFGIGLNRPLGSIGTDNLEKLILADDGNLVIGGSSTGNEGELASYLSKSNFCLASMTLEGELNWVQHYGGPQHDNCRDVIQTSDGGYLLAGTADDVGGTVEGNYGSSDAWLVKTDTEGNVEWTQNYGGSSYENAWAVTELEEGGYVFVGNTNSTDQDIENSLGNGDMWVVRINSTGNIIWSKNFGGSLYDTAKDIIQNTVGDLMVLGTSRSVDGDIPFNWGGEDLFILKIDVSGNIIWTQTYGGDANENAGQIIQSNTGRYIVAASSPSFNGNVPGNNGSYDGWIFELDESGNFIWNKTFGSNNYDFLNDVIQTNDNGYLAIGRSSSSSISETNSMDFYLIKLNPFGELSWEMSSGSLGFDDGTSVIQLANDDYFIGGQVAEASYDVPSNEGLSDMWVYQLSKNLGATVNIEASSLTLENGPVTLTASPPVSNPVWSTGETSQSIIVDSPDTYSLTGGEDDCINTDYITITETSCDLFVTSSDNSITIIGLSTSENTKLFDSNNSVVWECNQWSGPICTNEETITGLIAGETYYVSAQSDDCAEWIAIIVEEGTCTDNDNDGICANEDCNDNDPNLPTTPGISCDDGDSNTENDVILTDGCTCEGTPIEGACNVSVTSANGAITITGLTDSENTKLFDSDIEVVWGCNPWSGSPCSDVEMINGLTVGSTYYVSVQSDVCSEWISIVVEGGTCIDEDNDGVCASEDCDDNNPDLPTTPGTPCDDGNPNTENDEIQNDACTCEGTPIEEGCNVSVSTANGSITITGLTGSENTKLFDSSIEKVWGCNPWSGSPCTDSETITGLTVGATYFVSVESDECQEWIPVVIEDEGCTDEDNDGVCLDDDCDDTNPDIPTIPGTPCDDGNPNTENEEILLDGCTCAPVNNNLADLTIYDFTYSGATTLAQGEILEFAFAGVNIGTINSGSFTIKSYISTDQILSSDDVQDGIIPTGNWFPNTIFNPIGGALTVPSSLANGDYYVIVVADADDQVDELLETNNTIVALTTFTVDGETVDCPDGIGNMTFMGEYESHSYYISNEADYWLDAQGYANSVGGYLVSINNADENEFIRSYIDLTNEQVFIGYHDADENEIYEWDSGEEVTYINDNGAYLEEFATINFWNGEWSYDGIFHQRKFVIELPCVNDNSFNSAVVNSESGNKVDSELSLDLSISKVFPNPTSSDLFVQLQSDFDQKVDLIIYDRFGQALNQSSVDLEKGTQQLTIETDDFANGMYLLAVINSRGEKQWARFVRVR